MEDTLAGMVDDVRARSVAMRGELREQSIRSIRFVELGDQLTKDQMDCFNQCDLPWTFGDTTLVCITREDLHGWLEDLYNEKPLEEESEESNWFWKESIRKTSESLENLADDVLIALSCNM